MKMCKYIAAILSVAFGFSAIGMEREQVKGENIPLGKPLKITITNEELDKELCYFCGRGPEISIQSKNNNEVVSELRNKEFYPYGVTVYGGLAIMGDMQDTRVSAFFPMKGNSVEMAYYGLRDKYFGINIFYMTGDCELSQSTIQKHCSIMEKAFQSLPNILPELSHFTALQANIFIEERPYAGLVFNGLTCPSVSKFSIQTVCNSSCRIFKVSHEELQDLSEINISLRKCQIRSLKAQVTSTKMYGQDNEAMVQQQ